jgi:uncharacterized coiled-coil protein SlyX
MALDFTQLEAQVSRDETVNGSAAALIVQLAAEVEANKNDPAALQAFVDRLRASQDTLAAAVSANTPGATPPPA